MNTDSRKARRLIQWHRREIGCHSLLSMIDDVVILTLNIPVSGDLPTVLHCYLAESLFVRTLCFPFSYSAAVPVRSSVLCINASVCFLYVIGFLHFVLPICSNVHASPAGT